MRKEIICPCCNKRVQIILSDLDTGDVKIEGVFLNEENDLDISSSKLLSEYGICLGESEVNDG